MSINAIQIESQLKANYREFLIIQKQLEWRHRFGSVRRLGGRARRGA